MVVSDLRVPGAPMDEVEQLVNHEVFPFPLLAQAAHREDPALHHHKGKAAQPLRPSDV